MTTVVASTAVALSGLPPTVRPEPSTLPPSVSYTASRLNTTSSAVNGSPLENVTPFRSVTV